MLALALALLVILSSRDPVTPSTRPSDQPPDEPPPASGASRGRTTETKQLPNFRSPSPGPELGAPEVPPALRGAFEREAPDATAHRAEEELRAIYGAERDAETILRDVRCTRSVCKVDLRWSPELSAPYNNALNNALKAFSRDIDLAPDLALGGPEMPIPMTLFIARPGYTVASLLAEQRAR